MQTIVFVGPSFPPEHVTRFVPDADVRAPVRRDDLAEIDAPATVAILDGVFDGELSVSTREIRAAIGRGVRLVGASSMGAMRAAEVPEMRGVGRIFEMFRDGDIERDDEVAVMFDPRSFRPVTVPLVNVRFAVAALVRSGAIDSGLGTRIVGAASNMHFSDRVYQAILKQAGVADDEIAVLEAALRAIDLKREDAQTLLEQLPSLARKNDWPASAKTDERRGRYRDGFENARVHPRGVAHAPVQIWEYGEVLSFDELFTWFALDGILGPALREVLAKVDTSGKEFDEILRTEVPSAQDNFGEMQSNWGWRAPEEIHASLNFVGIGFADLQECLRHERRERAKVIAAFRVRPPEVLQAVRVRLVTGDLALKREAMRLGAIHVLASKADDAPASAAELDDARRAFLCNRPELSWRGLLAESGAREDDVIQLLSLVARARRVGVPLLRLLESGARNDETLMGVRELPAATGSVSDAEAVDTCRRLGRVMGVTRIAQLGELERFGLHVAAVYRPSDWSSSIASGKSETPEGAVIGGIMEELEKYCQEKFQPETVAHGTFRHLNAERGDIVIDPLDLALPYDSLYDPDLTIAWSWMDDLVSGGRVLVPSAHLSSERLANDVLFSPRGARKVFSSNGLASGFTVTEAVLHALCERIERHANKLSEQAISNPGSLPGNPCSRFQFVDLASCPPSSQRIVERIGQAGYECRVLDITCEVHVPTFAVRIAKADALHGLTDRYAVGSCTHPNPEVAINRALLEAVQTVVTRVSGGREDLCMKARSLGRHERPRPMSRGDAFWIRPHASKKNFTSVSGHTGKNARDDVEFIVRQLALAGFCHVLWRDISREEVSPARTVRVLIPGMEDTNPFHTGLRARTQIVQDLMHRHEW